MATFAEAYREAREAVDKKKEIRHLTAGLPVMRPVRGTEGLKAQLVARGVNWTNLTTAQMVLAMMVLKRAFLPEIAELADISPVEFKAWETRLINAETSTQDEDAFEDSMSMHASGATEFKRMSEELARMKVVLETVAAGQAAGHDPTMPGMGVGPAVAAGRKLFSTMHFADVKGMVAIIRAGCDFSELRDTYQAKVRDS